MANVVHVHIYEFQRFRRRRVRGRTVLERESVYLVLRCPNHNLEQNHDDEKPERTVLRNIRNERHETFCILIHCFLLGSVMLCLLAMFEDNLILYLADTQLIYGLDIFTEFYHHFWSSIFYESASTTLWMATELSAEAFGLFWMIFDHILSGIYTFMVLLPVHFIETTIQAVDKIPNYATSTGSWFLRNICHFFVILVAHFPGGIIGIGILLLVCIVVKMCAQQFYKQSKEYATCLGDIQQLQRQLEATEMQLKEQSHKLKQQIECFQELEENIEKLQQECDNLKSSNLNFQEEKDEKLCAICQDKVKTILLLPCQHLCLCKKCFDKKRWGQCPICRQGVESSMEVHIYIN